MSFDFLALPNRREASIQSLQTLQVSIAIARRRQPSWGSNSRSSFRNSPFSDFGSYMLVKNHKLHEQYDAEVLTSSNSGSSNRKPIFQGISIFVDEFTIPSSQELKGYMLKHGGRLCYS